MSIWIKQKKKMILFIIQDPVGLLLNSLQVYLDYLTIFIKKFTFSWKLYTLIIFIFSLLYFINFYYIKSYYQTNLADKHEISDPNLQEQTQGSQSNAFVGSSSGSSSNKGKGSSEENQNTDQKDSSKEKQENFLGDLKEEITIGEKAGLSSYEEGVLTLSLNKTFKRNKQKKKKW